MNHAEHVQICFDCAEACERCMTGCLGEEHVNRMAECIRLCRDCADFCTMCARLTARSSEFIKQFMVLCADVCDACADECSQHNDEHCRACAEACRRCADDCRRMSANA